MEKRRFRVLLCLLLGLAVMFAGCSSDDDDDGPDYNVSMDISYDTFEQGTVIKNKVLTNSTGNLYYYEYLTFTSSDSGTYSLYSFVHQNDATSEGIDIYTKLSENPFAADGEDNTLPTEFTYNSADGKITVTVAGKDVTTYFFTADSKTFAAQEILVPVTENDKSSLFREWNTASGEKYAFANGGKVNYKKTDAAETVQTTYTNDAGIILVNANIPFCWTKSSLENNLFYNAKETERKAVSEEGRSILCKTEIEFVSDGLMFARVW